MAITKDYISKNPRKFALLLIFFSLALFIANFLAFISTGYIYVWSIVMPAFFLLGIYAFIYPKALQISDPSIKKRLPAVVIFLTGIGIGFYLLKHFTSH